MSTEPELVEDLEQQIKDWPEQAKAVARRFPPTQCYREVARKHGHYWCAGYGVKRGTSEVALEVIHGADSFLPGMSTTLSVEQAVACGCGEWVPATEEQLAHMQEHFAALARARACAPKKS